MGFIKAFTGAVGGTFADQWKDYLIPPEGISATSVVFGAVPKGSNAGRGSNTKGSENIITNNSKIIVPEGLALVTLQDGRISNFIMEPGGYIYSNDDINAKSFFAGDSVSSTIKQSWERFKFGGQPGSQHIAVYVNLKEIPNNKFGTQSEIYWNDAYLGTQVSAKTRGTYTLKVIDPILLLTGFIPSLYLTSNAPIFDLGDMDNQMGTQLFNEVVSVLGATFSKYTNDADKGNRITNIQSDQLALAKYLGESVEETYNWKSGRGIIIERVTIMAIEYDEDTKALISDVKKADALSGNRGASFMQQSVARGLQSAGENPNGGATGMAFMGMGMNAGNNIMGAFGQNQQANINQNNNAEDPYEKLASLKKLLDEGIITQEDFDEVKRKTLGI